MIELIVKYRRYYYQIDTNYFMISSFRSITQNRFACVTIQCCKLIVKFFSLRLLRSTTHRVWEINFIVEPLSASLFASSSGCNTVSSHKTKLFA